MDYIAFIIQAVYLVNTSENGDRVAFNGTVGNTRAAWKWHKMAVV